MLDNEPAGPAGVVSVQTNGAFLRFHHHSVSPDLVISSGANSIKWAYTLNTHVQSTIGGEVIQILSSFVGPMTIEGMASSVDELVKIRDWFVKVFHKMGTVYRSGNTQAQFRDETAVLFEYPARGWSFQIMPTNLRGFKYDKTVFAPPWQVEAEIISDNALDFLSAATFSSFTGPLLNPNLYDVGFSDPTGTGPASRFVNPSLSGNIAGLGNTMGDNFQRLVEQWAGGGFGDFAYNSLVPYAKPTKTVKDEYDALFGTPGIQTAAGGSGSGSDNAASGSSIGGSSVVALINDAFEGRGIPGKLGVAVATHESGLNPDRTQDGCNQGDCGIGLFQVNGDGSGRDSSAAVVTAGKNRVYGSTKGNITPYYPADAQVSAAAGWFARFAHDDFPGIDMQTASDQTLALLAAHAQGAKDQTGFAAAIAGGLAAAEKLIADAAAQTLQVPGTVSGDAQAIAKRLVALGERHADIVATASGQDVRNRNGIATAIDARVLGVIEWAHNNYGPIGLSAICSDHDVEANGGGHGAGRAVDISIIRGQSLRTTAARQPTLSLDASLDSATGQLRPNQLITAGVGAGAIDNTFLAYCMVDGKVVSPEYAYTYYTGPVLAVHTNHVHIGYA